jgi:hypothetical protein
MGFRMRLRDTYTILDRPSAKLPPAYNPNVLTKNSKFNGLQAYQVNQFEANMEKEVRVSS